MLTAAAFAQLAGMWQNGTPFPMIGFMIAASVLALAIFIVSLRSARLSSTHMAVE
jgi:hypothetical protein